jgi:hypothetical protein
VNINIGFKRSLQKTNFNLFWMFWASISILGGGAHLRGGWPSLKVRAVATSFSVFCVSLRLHNLKYILCLQVEEAPKNSAPLSHKPTVREEIKESDGNDGNDNE